MIVQIVPYDILSRGFWLTVDNGSNRLVELAILHDEYMTAFARHDLMHMAVVEGLIEDNEAIVEECAHVIRAFMDMSLS